MEQLFEVVNWALVIKAVVTTFIVSALNTTDYFKQVTNNKLVFFVALLVSLLSIPLIGGNLEYWQGLLYNLLLTMAFSVLFYNYIGKWFVDKFFELLKDKITK
jgi:hypothetical protein